jgi:hypothetical protein
MRPQIEMTKRSLVFNLSHPFGGSRNGVRDNNCTWNSENLVNIDNERNFSIKASRNVEKYVTVSAAGASKQP